MDIEKEFEERLHVIGENQRRSLVFLDNLLAKIYAHRVRHEAQAMEPLCQDPTVSSSTPKKIYPDPDDSDNVPNSTAGTFEISEGVSSSTD